MRRAALMLCALLCAAPAAAHKVVAAAYPAGDAIEGEIGFSNGDMAAGTIVEVFDGDGARLGETTTDATGFFIWPVAARVDHVFRADLGAGHVAEIRVPAADLPQSLSQRPPQSAAPVGAPSSAPSDPVPASGLTEAELALIAEAVRAEMRPLRRELVAYREATDLQRVLGGVGYIFGLFGVGFYVAARRRLAQR